MKHRNSRSALFLMELIFAILFFAITNAVCVQLFVRAYTYIYSSAGTRRI